ncbi:MAG: GNAT family N-acetyltransferase [candidate division Zixibacteria bacterium]|nr:GNAT family N-acetyltransferase [candidate division Zixibacteria bacterium]
MGHRVERPSIDHYDEIIRVWSEAGLEYKPHGRDSRELIAREMALPQCAFFGLFEEGRMIGAGIANWDGRRGWINRVAIIPGRRGNRLAVKIVEACEAFLREKGALVICGLIHKDNAASISCFEREGYSCMDEVGYFSKRTSWED